jgi:hypothetical protein
MDAISTVARAASPRRYFIDEVVVGPTPSPRLTIEAVQALFASEGHPEVLIKNSHISLRVGESLRWEIRGDAGRGDAASATSNESAAPKRVTLCFPRPFILSRLLRAIPTQRKESDPLPPFIHGHERTFDEIRLIRLKSLDQALTDRFRESIKGADLNDAWPASCVKDKRIPKSRSWVKTT